MQISRVGIITHPEVKNNIVEKIIQKLSKYNLQLFFDPITARTVNKPKTNVNEMFVDLAIVLGGDGTILWAVNKLKQDPIILGINTGRIGYLTELNTKNTIQGINNLLQNKFYVDERMRLKVNNKFNVLNEAVVSSHIPASLLEFRIKQDNIPISKFRADGVLISTQTGSTGYSLSLGGPVIHPNAKTYLITPMNSFIKEQMPIIIPDDSKITIELLREDRNAYLILDGSITKILYPHDIISIEKSQRTVKFVRFGKNAKYKHISNIKFRVRENLRNARKNS